MATHRDLYIKNNLSIFNDLKIYDTTKAISISAPALANNYALVLPAAQGTNKTALVNDGSGNLSYEIVNQQNVNTGFYSWTGSGNYWSITAGPTFNLLRGGTGYIKNKPISFNGSQSASITINSHNYFYIDGSGILQDSNTYLSSLYADNIVLFEVLHDGTNYVVKKENHPVDFATQVSSFLHQNLGCIVRGAGAVLTVSATARKVKIVGDDYLEDHGLTSTILAADPITIQFWYTNVSNQWIQYANTDTIPNYYNLSGTPTILTANRYGVFRLYAIMDNLNTATCSYIAVMAKEQFTTLGNATTAINTNDPNVIPSATNELYQLEPCQLGFIIIQYSGAGVVNSVIVQKNTFNAKYVGSTGGSTSSHLLLSDLNSGSYGIGGHTNVAQRYLSASSDPGPTNDVASFLTSCIWVREDNDTIFVCVDNTSTAAVWQQLEKRLKTITAVSAALSLTNVNHILNCSTTTESYNITLPLSNLFPGIDYIIVYLSKTASYTVTIVTSGSDKIDNDLTSVVLTNQFDRIRITSIGSMWVTTV